MIRGEIVVVTVERAKRSAEFWRRAFWRSCEDHAVAGCPGAARDARIALAHMMDALDVVDAGGCRGYIA